MNPLRRILLWASTSPWLGERLPRRRFVQRAVHRFMPGESLDDAFGEAELLGASGVAAIVTMLGENVETEAETRAIVDEYARAIEEAARRGLDAEISIKPTHLGLDRDAGFVAESVGRLASLAEGRGTVWIDMESTRYVQRTIDLYRALKAEHDNVGVCLQSYLRRTPADLKLLLPLAPRVRLVKGAYAEPPELAYPVKADVDASYLALATRFLDHQAGGGGGFIGFGTHDPELIARLTDETRARGLTREHFEFEMLFGIGRREQERLVDAGLPLRVLISYGDAWFPWYMRRLAERPANVWFVMKSMWR